MSSVRLRRIALMAVTALALGACASNDTAEPTATNGESRSGDTTTSVAAAGPVGLEAVWAGLDQPVGLTAPPGDDRVFVIEQPGRLLVAENPGGRLAEWIDLSDEVGSEGTEQGLLGLAFHPDFAQNGLVYVDYTDHDGDTQIVELTVDPASGTERVDVLSRRVLLSIRQPFSNHNGGNLAFGPDGRLWVGTGDGGSGGDPDNRAQDDDDLLGKMIRLDVDTATPEIWAKGLRNPWRYSFDRATGDLWIGDVGQDAQEEVSVIRAAEQQAPAGPNLGWSAFEGDRTFDADIDIESHHAPVAVYDHDDPAGGGCSVTGGHVYRGPTIPGIDGRFVFGDYCSGIVWTLDATDPGTAERLEGVPAGLAISSFGEDSAGRLYLVDHNGTIHVFVSTPD